MAGGGGSVDRYLGQGLVLLFPETKINLFIVEGRVMTEFLPSSIRYTKLPAPNQLNKKDLRTIFNRKRTLRDQFSIKMRINFKKGTTLTEAIGNISKFKNLEG